MISIKNKLSKTYKSDYFPFVILFIAMLILHMIIKMNYGDDLYFKEIIKQNELLDWLKLRYMTWSSRIIIETVMVTLLGYCMNLWKVIDLFMILLLATSLSKLFVEENKKNNNWIIVGLIFLYPFTDMKTAGWGATTINYLWPLALGIYSFIIIKKIFYGEKIKWNEYIYSTLALLFAANQEQMCAIIFAIYSMLIIYFILKHKPKFYIIFQTILCLISFVFILSCPGNAARKATETGKWFVDYNMFSLVNKIELGFSSSIGKFVFQSNLIFVVFSILICIVIFIKYDDVLFRIISIIPFVCSIFFPYKSQFAKSITQYGIITFDNFTSVQGYVLIILLGVIGVCVLLSLYFCFGNTIKSVFIIFIVLLGFASRIVMGFSPTIWVSDDRTFLFMYFSFIISAIMIYNEIWKFKYINLKLINYIICMFSVLEFISLLAKI